MFSMSCAVRAAVSVERTKRDGGFVACSEFFFHMLDDADVAPQALARDQAGDVGEGEGGFVAEKVHAVLFETAAGFLLFLRG